VTAVVVSVRCNGLTWRNKPKAGLSKRRSRSRYNTCRRHQRQTWRFMHRIVNPLSFHAVPWRICDKRELITRRGLTPIQLTVTSRVICEGWPIHCRLTVVWAVLIASGDTLCIKSGRCHRFIWFLYLFRGRARTALISTTMSEVV